MTNRIQESVFHKKPHHVMGSLSFYHKPAEEQNDRTKVVYARLVHQILKTT